MPRRILFFFLTVLATTSPFAQKIKVKKDKIYINRVEMYRIVETGKNRKAILAVEDGDTLIWMNRKKLINTKASFETEQKVLNYWELKFAYAEFNFNFISSDKDDIYESLIRERVLSNQAVSKDNLRKFKELNYTHDLVISLLEQAIVRRDELLEDKDYDAYANLNGLRSPNAGLWVSNKIVLSRTMEDGTPTGLGRIENTPKNSVDIFKVYRHSDQKLIGTIEFDFKSNIMSINTSFDQMTVSNEFPGFYSRNFLYAALHFLSDAGYF